MPQLSPAGQQIVRDIAQRTGFSPDAVATMLDAVLAGRGGMAQFSHPEFGGSGQWMRGGMTMIGDMFNGHLKGRVVALCEELAALVGREPGLIGGGGSFQSQSQGNQQQARDGGAGQPHGGGSEPARLFVAGGNWWPAELGSPSSTGSQNDVRYAYFGQSHRLAIDLGGRITVYDTLDHRIGGFGQQQGYGGSLTFTSQHGTVDVASLPVVAGEGAGSAAPAAPSASPEPAGGDVFASIEKLAGLHAKGILTQDEFDAKKAELLRRL